MQCPQGCRYGIRGHSVCGARDFTQISRVVQCRFEYKPPCIGGSRNITSSGLDLRVAILRAQRAFAHTGPEVRTGRDCQARAITPLWIACAE